MENKTLSEILLDETNNDFIYLTLPDGLDYPFEQLGSLCYDDTLYAIVSPTEDIFDLTKDDLIILKVVEVDGVETLELEEDEKLASEVYQEYMILLNQSK